jgi:hypothetical protein
MMLSRIDSSDTQTTTNKVRVKNDGKATVKLFLSICRTVQRQSRKQTNKQIDITIVFFQTQNRTINDKRRHRTTIEEFPCLFIYNDNNNNNNNNNKERSIVYLIMIENARMFTSCHTSCVNCFYELEESIVVCACVFLLFSRVHVEIS